MRADEDDITESFQRAARLVGCVVDIPRLNALIEVQNNEPAKAQAVITILLTCASYLAGGHRSESELIRRLRGIRQELIELGVFESIDPAPVQSVWMLSSSDPALLRAVRELVRAEQARRPEDNVEVTWWQPGSD